MVESDHISAAIDGLTFAFTNRATRLLTSCKPMADISRIHLLIVCRQRDSNFLEGISKQNSLKDSSFTRAGGCFV